MTKLSWGLIGGGEGSQIGPAHRLSAAVDGEFAFVAGALDHRPAEGRAACATYTSTGFPRYWYAGSKTTAVLVLV